MINCKFWCGHWNANQHIKYKPTQSMCQQTGGNRVIEIRLGVHIGKPLNIERFDLQSVIVFVDGVDSYCSIIINNLILITSL